jgi:hypothetical protein
MINKLAKLKFLPNNFEIIEEGDHVICAISKKKIPLENLNYWNVDKQEAYYSYIESSIEREKKNYITNLSICCESKSTDLYFLQSFFLVNY